MINIGINPSFLMTSGFYIETMSRNLSKHHKIFKEYVSNCDNAIEIVRTKHKIGLRDLKKKII